MVKVNFLQSPQSDFEFLGLGLKLKASLLRSVQYNASIFPILIFTAKISLRRKIKSCIISRYCTMALEPEYCR